MPTQQVYRNCMYYLVSATATKVIFEGHYSRYSVYRTVNECSVDNWNSCRLFEKT